MSGVRQTSSESCLCPSLSQVAWAGDFLVIMMGIIILAPEGHSGFSQYSWHMCDRALH